jgi:tRNA threonylcarbamoyladenosine biosynthesis protein TsaB
MIIAFESSGSVASVAIWHDGRIAWREAHGAKAAENSLPMAAEAMAELGVALAALEAVAFGAGPGAFTGVRAACAVAQGLAYARDVPILAVPSLMAVAQAALVSANITGIPPDKSTQVLALTDARMGEVYVAAYRFVVDGWHEVLPAALMAPQDIAQLPLKGEWCAAGSGVALCADSLRSMRVIAAQAPDITPHARDVAALAAALRAQGHTGVNAAAAAPLYVRDKVALTSAERAQGLRM